MAISKTKANTIAAKVKKKKRLLNEAVQRGDKAMVTYHDMGLKELTLATKPQQKTGDAAPGVTQLPGGGIKV